MNAKTLGIIGTLAACVLAALIVGAVIASIIQPSFTCPEGFVADETYEVCCPDGTVYDLAIDKCRTPPETTQPSVPFCSEDEYLGADNQCHPKDTPEEVFPEEGTQECPDGYYMGYEGICHRIPEEGETHMRLSMLPGTVQGTAITFLTLIAFVSLWWVVIKPRI